MRKLVLEALAAGLALAVVSGQAGVAMPTDAVPKMISRGKEVSANGSIIPDRAVASPVPRETGVPQRVALAQNLDNGQAKEVRTIRIDDEQAVKSSPVTEAQPVSRAAFPIPEPGSWGTALAGLLGVIAIARRRMSL
jgi:hypothetical protein